MKIEKRTYKGIELAGYIVSENGEEKELDIPSTVENIENGSIENAEALYSEEHGRKVAFVNEDIGYVKSEDEDKLTVVSRIVDGEKVVGYIVKDKSDREYKINNNNFWKKAACGGVESVRAAIQGRNRVVYVDKEIETVKV